MLRGNKTSEEERIVSNIKNCMDELAYRLIYYPDDKFFIKRYIKRIKKLHKEHLKLYKKRIKGE